MQINNLSNISFGKYPILNCQVKDSKTKQKKDATLYKYDPHNVKDMKEIRQRQIPFGIDEMGYTKIYILEDDETKDIVSCAQTSRHYRSNNLHQAGFSTLIEDMESSKAYINPSEPLIAGLAKEAQDRSDSSIFLARPIQDVHSISNVRMAANKLGEHYLTERRFNSVIDKACEHSQIEFLI
ncbi:hypothetical protein IJX73_01165 [bacterium]|nr:hypothetical protein [bacterium]MBQ9149519.1 hypothetical protein [bacterium]